VLFAVQLPAAAVAVGGSEPVERLELLELLEVAIEK